MKDKTSIEFYFLKKTEQKTKKFGHKKQKEQLKHNYFRFNNQENKPKIWNNKIWRKQILTITKIQENMYKDFLQSTTLPLQHWEMLVLSNQNQTGDGSEVRLAAWILYLPVKPIFAGEDLGIFFWSCFVWGFTTEVTMWSDLIQVPLPWIYRFSSHWSDFSVKAE